MGSSVSSGVISVTSPSQTSLFSFILKPIARRKFSIKISVFFTSDEYTSEPTIKQKGTFGPSSWETPRAIAVFPVPGGPAKSKAFPAIFFDFINSTTIPQAWRASIWPTRPQAISIGFPSLSKPRPFMCECELIRCVFVVDLTSWILTFIFLKDYVLIFKNSRIFILFFLFKFLIFKLILNLFIIIHLFIF